MLILSCVAGMLVAILSTRLPATGPFAYARVVATLLSVLVFGSMLEKLVAPDRDRWLLRAVDRAKPRRWTPGVVAASAVVTVDFADEL
jgi:hypothetical protein